MTYKTLKEMRSAVEAGMKPELVISKIHSMYAIVFVILKCLDQDQDQVRLHRYCETDDGWEHIVDVSKGSYKDCFDVINPFFEIYYD